MKLYAYLDAKTEYERLERQIEEIETRIQGLGVDYSKVKIKTTPNNDKIADNIDELNKLHKEAELKMQEQVKTMQAVLKAIDSVEDATKRDILQRRYIEGESWESIAVEKNYSWRHIQRLHAEAKELIKGGE